jgi:hypothetical protein
MITSPTVWLALPTAPKHDIVELLRGKKSCLLKMSGYPGANIHRDERIKNLPALQETKE